MTEKAKAEEATRTFYQAIESMVDGRGLEPMFEIWHHGDDVSSKHPSGDWSRGWDEIKATWELFASFGRAGNGGSSVDKVEAVVCGDLAYATSIFQASPFWGGEKMMCTNVLRKVDGQWKIVHHHADPSPAMGAALEKMLAGG